jgi:hypothetical protein
MSPTKPALLVLPFQARQGNALACMTFDEVLHLYRHDRAALHIERSYPGAPCAIGWTIFRRTVLAYLHEDEPLFRFERGARAHIRKAYALYYARTAEDGLDLSRWNL